MTRDMEVLIERLLLLRERLGHKTYAAAIRKAKVAVAQVVLVEVERRCRSGTRPSAIIIQFPTQGGRRRK